MLDDVRYALRLMARQKTFTAAAVLTLALGIGATTAIFSMVYGVLLRPLPYPTADRLVRISEEHPGGVALVRSPMLSNVVYNAWLNTSQTLEGLAAYASQELTLVTAGDPVRVSGATVTPALFRILAVHPLLGRVLQDDDVREGADPVVVLAHQFWRDQFASDAAVVERSITLEGKVYSVIGVMPPDFYFPDRRVQVWAPYRVPRPEDNPSRPFWGMWAFGLLRPGATPAEAAAEGTVMARSTGPRPMAADLVLGKGGPVEVRVRPLLEEATAGVRPALLLLLASVGLVLLIACANISNLLLARGVARRRELAVRASIGAGRTRLVRQLVTEALVLSLAGGALGVLLASFLTQAIPALAPASLPRLADIHLDGVAVAFACAIAIAAGLVAGSFPAMRLAHGSLLAALREGSGASAGRRTRRLGAALLAAEAAIAVVLLVGAVLLGRSFVRLLAVDPGFATEQVLVARVHLPPRPLGSDRAADDREELFAQALLARVRAVPGVAAAGIGNMAPLVGMTAAIQIALRGDSAEPINARTLAYVITPGYAEALSMRLREGRFFEERDVAAGIRPVLVNEEFVSRHLRDGRPVAGRRFTTTLGGEHALEIVGVVANVLKDGLDRTPQPEMYRLPREAFGLPSTMHLVVRTAVDPLAAVTGVRQAVRDVDATAALDNVETLTSRVSASVGEPRFAMAVLMAFAALAMLLAAVGLYGVLSYHVLQRRREMGVRAALGATRTSIVALVVGEGLRVTVAGVAVGLVGAAWLSQLIAGLLFGVTPHDPIAFGIAPFALLLVALVATVLPARRAASTDPVEVLRAE